DVVAVEVVDRLDVGVGTHEEGVQRLDVGVGEVDVRLALVGDRHGGGADVARAGRERGAGLQRVEAHVLHGELQVELLRHGSEEVDVEAGVLDVAGRVLDLERRVRHIRAHGQNTRLDQTVLVVGGGSVTASRVGRSGR